MTATAAVEPRVGNTSPGLARYVVTRLAAAVAVLFAVSIGVFLFIHLAPGGPEYALAGRLATPEKLEAIRQKYGLDEPLARQYLSYLGSLVRLDMGESFTRKVAVTDSITSAATVTVPLMLMAWVLPMTLGIALGLLTASRPGGLVDRAVLGATIVGASAPAFAVGTLLAYVFGIKLGWLPVTGAGDGGFDRVKHLILPAVTASVILLATCTKVSRVRIGQILEEDQTTFSRARGLSRTWMLGRVVLKNAGVQLVTLSGGLLIGLLSGMLIVEQVFNLPGLGTLMFDSVRQRDIPLLQGLTLLVAAFVVVVNLVVDLVCMAVDPRLRAGLRAGAS